MSGFKERLDKASETDVAAREIITNEKAQREANMARLRAEREAAEAAAPKPPAKQKKGKR